MYYDISEKNMKTQRGSGSPNLFFMEKIMEKERSSHETHDRKGKKNSSVEWIDSKKQKYRRNTSSGVTVR